MIGEKIKEIRIAKKLSMQDMADKMGYAYSSTVARIESGAIDVPWSKLKKFADVLGVPVEYLISDSDKSVEEWSISEDERALIELFRKVPPDQQEMVLSMIRAALGKR